VLRVPAAILRRLTIEVQAAAPRCGESRQRRAAPILLDR
jgi:hypothetical protein